jgi:hypothetical protein
VASFYQRSWGKLSVHRRSETETEEPDYQILTLMSNYHVPTQAEDKYIFILPGSSKI